LGKREGVDEKSDMNGERSKRGRGRWRGRKGESEVFEGMR